MNDLERRAHAAPPESMLSVNAGALVELITRLHVAESALRTIVRQVVAATEMTGQAVTVERVPGRPLAMGNHVPSVSFRPYRGRA